MRAGRPARPELRRLLRGYAARARGAAAAIVCWPNQRVRFAPVRLW